MALNALTISTMHATMAWLTGLWHLQAKLRPEKWRNLIRIADGRLQDALLKHWFVALKQPAKTLPADQKIAIWQTLPLREINAMQL